MEVFLLKYVLIAGLIFLLAACSTSNDDQQAEGEMTYVPIEINEATEASDELEAVVADQLEVPWSIEELDGTFYLTERAGTIVTIIDGEASRHEVQLEHPIHAEGEGGLMGLVLDPNFEQNKKAYVYHTYLENNEILNRIVKIEHEDGKWTEREELLSGIPGGRTHNGGRLAIGPDGYLYATTGDAGIEELAQEPEQMAGVILRMGLDGSIPEDNPMSDSYVFSYGHRNPQGLTWLEDGTMYSSEHGPRGHDELNQIEPGNNYGWPTIIGDETGDGKEVSVFHSGSDTMAPSGMAAYDYSLYVAALRGAGVYRYDVQLDEIEKVLDGYGRIRDVKIIEDELYFITNNTDGRGTPMERDDKLIKVMLNEDLE